MPFTEAQIEKRLQHFVGHCRARGVRLTRQRLEVFRMLARTDAHPDAETVWAQVRKRLPRVSLDTIYRTLASLERADLVAKVGALHGAARFDANAAPHNHFVCNSCGIVRDVPGSHSAGFSLPQQAGELGRIDSVHTVLRGICADCLVRKRPRHSSAPSRRTTTTDRGIPSPSSPWRNVP